MGKYDNILKFYKEYIRIEQIIREGWLMRNVPAQRLESVADHTLQLIMLASVIVRELNLSFDMHKLTDMLLIHDIGEIIIGDISEIDIDRDIKKAHEAEAVKSILDTLGSDSATYYYDLWIEREKQETDISKFAYLLDKIDAVIKAGIYEENYNLEGLFKEFFEFQQKKSTFVNTDLEEFFNYIIFQQKNNND